MNDFGQQSRQVIGRQGSRRLSIIFFLAVSVILLVFSLYGARASAFEKARGVVLDIFEPVLVVFSTPISWTENRIGDVNDYFNTLEQNRQLKAENEELRAWMQEALTLRQQVEYFQKLLDVRVADDASFVDAQVIGESGGPYERSLIVNAGAMDGVQVGDGAISTTGLVGHVITAGRSSSRVLMLTDYNNRTPVFIEGAEVEGILAGRNVDEPELKFLATRDRDRIQPGMRVITSGTGGALPRGLAVGEIGRVSDELITVRLFTQYNDTDFVRIVDYAFAELDADLEEGAASETLPGGVGPELMDAPPDNSADNPVPGETGNAGEAGVTAGNDAPDSADTVNPPPAGGSTGDTNG